MQVQSKQPRKPAVSQAQQKRVWILLAGSSLLLLALLLLLFLYSRKPVIPLTPAMKSQLEVLRSRCLVVHKGAIAMQGQMLKQSGTAPMLSMLLPSNSDLEKGCAQIVDLCAEDFDGTLCKQERYVIPMFLVLQDKCFTNPPHSMETPACQEMYKVCVGGGMENKACLELMRRYGVNP